MINLIKMLFFEKSKFDHGKLYLNDNPGFNRIRSYFWSLISNEKRDAVRNFKKATIFSRFLRKILFPPSMRPGYDFFNFYLKKEHIDLIKSYRNDKVRSTDRFLAERFAEKFPETNIISGDQYDGRWIGEYAADYLNDDTLRN